MNRRRTMISEHLKTLIMIMACALIVSGFGCTSDISAADAEQSESALQADGGDDESVSEESISEESISEESISEESVDEESISEESVSVESVSEESVESVSEESV